MNKIFKSNSPSSRSDNWSKFTEDKRLLAEYRVTADELVMLKSMVLLGSLQTIRDFLAVLKQIRFARRPR
jgi:hypothetical protein